MWSTNRMFYDEPEPNWVIDTAASQMIRYPQRTSAPPPPVQVVVPRVDLQQVHPQPLVRSHVPNAPEFRVLEFRMPLCCEGCERRVVKRLHKVRGVDSVRCDFYRHKVTVTGFAPPGEVLHACKKLFKRSEFWNPVHLVPVVHMEKVQNPVPHMAPVVHMEKVHRVG